MTDDLNRLLGIPAGAMPADCQRLLAVIHLFDEAIHYTRYDDDGRVARAHQISPGDLAAALSGVPLATGPLPKRCLFYARAGGEERIAVYLPPAVRPLAVALGERHDVYNVPCPPLVFLGQGPGYHVLAVRQRPGQDDRLYHAPFPNVHVGGDGADAGRICTGTADFPPCSGTSIYRAVDAFFESNFNDHITDGKSRAGTDVLAIWQALHEAGAEEYPLDDLVATRLTLKDLAGGAR